MWGAGMGCERGGGVGWVWREGWDRKEKVGCACIEGLELE